MAQKLEQFKKLLPEKLTVEIHKEKTGYWAKIKELPHCYTQADNYDELIIMINDAVYTYLDIPIKYIKTLGYYIPEWQKRVYDMLFKQKERKPIKSWFRVEDFTLSEAK
ncbi:MAG: hypothetical protein HYS44_01020 [Candidatus Niyogibacteria bacterium]|nr:hypothetical protein [Candidatus Niyogibacteria bacterium]